MKDVNGQQLCVGFQGCRGIDRGLILVSVKEKVCVC